VRRGRDWFAVRTGVDSNDMNGVVSQARAEVSAELVDDLVAWFRADAVSASWLTTIPDPQLTRTLLAAGARAERTGYWSDCSMPTPVRPPAAGVEVVRIVSDHHLEKWLDVAAECGWVEDDSDREARHRLYLALGLDGGALTHWLALDHDQPVGFASSFLDANVIDLCNLGVAESHAAAGLAGPWLRPGSPMQSNAALRESSPRRVPKAGSSSGRLDSAAYRLSPTLGSTCQPTIGALRLAESAVVDRDQCEGAGCRQ